MTDHPHDPLRLNITLAGYHHGELIAPIFRGLADAPQLLSLIHLRSIDLASGHHAQGEDLITLAHGLAPARPSP